LWALPTLNPLARFDIFDAFAENSGDRSMSATPGSRALNILLILVLGAVAIYVAWSLRTQIEPAAAVASPSSTAVLDAASLESPDALLAALRGGDPNARNTVAGPEQGMTALMYAARDGRGNNVKALIDAKASVNAQAADGRTALMYAAMSTDAACTRALLDAGASVDARDDQGVTSLMLAAARGEVAGVEALLRAGASPEFRNKWGENALLYAARTGSIGKVRVLLNAGASIDAVNNRGESALWLLFENEPEPDMIALLLGRGAKVNQADSASRVTPLMRAAALGSAPCVKLLLNAGADPAPKDGDGLTARQWAANRGDERGREVVALLDAHK
jgi:ankyrin repeat protein